MQGYALRERKQHFSYSMNEHKIENVDHEKNLGVMFSSDLKVSVQRKEAYSKANCILGLINRTIKYKYSATLISLYKSMVRPHLEYCSVVWSPHYNKDKMPLEKIQHRFTRLFPNLRKLPYEDKLGQLRLWSLEKRRNRTDLIQLYWMVKSLSATSCRNSFIELWKLKPEDTWKLAKNCRSDARLHFFSQRIINRWNSLSQKDIDAPYINSFKNCLERIRTRQMDF